jgi:hypothetical protein
MTEGERRFFSNPIMTWPMFIVLLMYGGPTAWTIGLVCSGRHLPGWGFLVAWGGLASLAAIYFIVLHIRCARHMKGRP